MYSENEVLEASLKYFNGNELAAKVFVHKYALRDNDNNFLEKTPDDMHHRLAREFARIENKKFSNPLSEQEIFNLFHQFKYIIPQGSPMYGIGNNYTIQSLGNCFTLGNHPYDSYGGICYADQMLVQLSKRRCGVGLSLDNIRPKGLPTKNAAKTTDGIGVFMERFSNSIREVAQNGRRGASLQGISIHHPEVETFINSKKDLTKITGANISVILTDEFMNAVVNNTTYEQRWPINSSCPSILKQVSARAIWSQIINNAWLSAEPGLLFIDNARKFSTSHCYAKKDARFADVIPNPCGEIWMGEDSCRLMLINLYNYVKNPFTKDVYFDFDLFKKHSRIIQRLMDDMVDLEIEKMESILKKIDSDPEPISIKKIEQDMWKNYLEVAKLGRRTGTGITGLGDCLAALNIKYGSNESIEVTESIYKTLCVETMISSCLLAKELGPFPIYDKELEIDNLFLNRCFDSSEELRKLHHKYGRRNISLTTTSPAGTVSLLTNTTSGIEPVFLLEYTRRRKLSKDTNKYDFVDKNGDKWEETKISHHHLDTWRQITGKSNIEDSPYYKATSNDVDWEASIKLQSVAQKWITHSISKTCNIPNNSSKELVETIYLQAWKDGLKGFTVYRDGCRDGVLVSTSNKKQSKRPKELKCDVHHAAVAGKQYFILIGKLEDNSLYEIFAGKNGFLDKEIKTGRIIKKGKSYKAIFDDEDKTELSPITSMCNEHEEPITRLCSALLRSGAEIQLIVEQLEKVNGDITSFAKALARTLKKYLKNGTELNGEACPECKATLIMQEGCKSCKNCSYSKCS